MNLLIASGIAPPEIGGPATYLEHLVPLLQQDGWHVTTLAFGDGRPGTISRRGIFPLRFLRYTRRLFKLAKSCDVIYTLDNFSAGLPALIVSTLRRKPLVSRIGGIFAYEEETKRNPRPMTAFLSSRKRPLISLLFFIQGLILRHSNHVIATSPFLANVCARQGVPLEKISIITTAPVLHKLPDRKTLRNELHLDPHKTYLVSASRLIPHKDVATIIRALAELPQNYHLIIIGKGPEEQHLRDLAEHIGVSNRVNFLLKQTHETTQKYLKAADAYVLNSTYEGLSNTALEAIGQGTPVFLSRVEGNTDLVTDSENGYLFTQGNPADIAKKLKHLHTPDIIRITSAAHVRLSTWENVHAKTKHVLESLTLNTPNSR
ncbi:glycosyltransferase [Candidatus Woesearchaeota archaeon]|nr:MAG: glycosyltransferase [Candidatus Woesearchaeota archaeon]